MNRLHTILHSDIEIVIIEIHDKMNSYLEFNTTLAQTC